GEIPAARRRAACRLVELRLPRARPLYAQAGGAEGALSRGQARLRRDRAGGPRRDPDRRDGRRGRAAQDGAAHPAHGRHPAGRHTGAGDGDAAAHRPPGRAPAHRQLRRRAPARRHPTVLVERAPVPLAEEAWKRRADALLGVAASAILLAMMLLTVVDVVARYIFSRPVGGAFEITELMLVVLIFAGLPLGSFSDEHAVMDFIDRVLCLRVPISFAMAIVGIAGYAYMRDWNWTVAFAMTQTKLYETGRNYTLSVVPLFILMGNFVTRAGMSQELFRAAYAFIGHLRGGLAMATIWASAGFGGICGSSIATAATFAKVAYPSMKKFGYSD